MSHRPTPPRLIALTIALGCALLAPEPLRGAGSPATLPATQRATQPAAPAAAAAADVEQRVREQIAVLRDFVWWTDNDPWARAILTLVDAGRDGMPVILAELRDSDSPRIQRTAPLALAEVGDRRAVPFLIHALARSRPDTGNNGFSIPDGEMYFRIRRLIGEPVDSPHGDAISDDRPEQVITAALERLTGHREPTWHFGSYGDDGGWPKEWGELTYERKRQVTRRMADRWWAWWEANGASLLTPEEKTWLDAHAPTKYQQPPADAGRALALTVRDAAGAAVADAALEVWADRHRYALKTDQAGRATIPLRADVARVSVVAEKPGLVPTLTLWGKDNPLPAAAEVTLQPAAVASGVVRDALDKPAPGATVWLVGPLALGKHACADVAFREVRSDADGRWRTAQLPESAKKLRVFVAYPGHRLLESKATDAAALRDGSHVVGGAWQLTVAELALPPAPDDPTGRARGARGGTSFELPAAPGNPPLDLGDLELAVTTAPLQPGMPAPPIETVTLDGKPLKLADFAGRYVLLDFWATWCGPCLAETPHLKAVHDAYRGDDRLAIIGLSLDGNPRPALAYAKAHGFDWTQGFLGNWGEHRALADYGIRGIPEIMLIGPDGKVIATGLRQEGILKTVRDALGGRKGLAALDPRRW